MHDHEINGLPLPPLLLELMSAGRWADPGQEVLARAVGFPTDPLMLLSTLESIRRETSNGLADDPETSALFRMMRGSRSAAAIDLPWLDVDRAVLIAVNVVPGDDVAVALDYRSGGIDDPRVVASAYDAEANRCVWREVTPSFSEFVRRLGL